MSELSPKLLAELEQSLSAELRKKLSVALSETESPAAHAKQAALLKKRFDALHEVHRFNVGQLVRWKDGLRNRLRPGYDEPALVLQVLDEPIYDTNMDSGDPSFREPLDIVLAVLGRRGDSADGETVLLTYYYDRRRIEPLPAGPHPEPA